MFFDILGQTFQVFFAKPILLVYPLITWGLSLVIGGISFSLLSNVTSVTMLICLGIPIIFISAILGALPTLASAYVVYEHLHNREASIMEGFEVAFSRIGNILSFMLVAIGAFIVAAIGMLIPCLNIAVYIAVIIVALAASLVVPVIAVEGRGGLSAYHRSAELVNNTRGVVVALFLIGIAIAFVFAFYLNSIGAFNTLRYRNTLPSLGIFDNPVFQFAYNIIGTMFSSIFATVWYQEARNQVDVAPTQDEYP